MNAYNHIDAFAKVFGITDGSFFIEKAARDLARYEQTDAKDEDRLDALLDFAAAIVSLEDWTFPGAPTTEDAWKSGHRNASAEHALLVLIALVAKHRTVRDGRFSKLELIGIDELRTWTEDATPNAVLAWFGANIPSAKTKSIITQIEDDEIVGYEITFDLPQLKVGEKPRPVQDILKSALEYWRGQLAAN
jgi:hypothetical protein